MKQHSEFAKDYIEAQEASKWPHENPHPMRKVPGFPRKAEWNRYQGRWVIRRAV